MQLYLENKLIYLQNQNLNDSYLLAAVLPSILLNELNLVIHFDQLRLSSHPRLVLSPCRHTTTKNIQTATHLDERQNALLKFIETYTFYIYKQSKAMREHTTNKCAILHRRHRQTYINILAITNITNKCTNNTNNERRSRIRVFFFAASSLSSLLFKAKATQNVFKHGKRSRRIQILNRLIRSFCWRKVCCQCLGWRL